MRTTEDHATLYGWRSTSTYGSSSTRVAKSCLIDFAECQPSEFLERIRYARSVIGRQPPRSARTLTVVTKARFNGQVSEAMKEYTSHNKPYVRAAAVVGLSGLQEIVYNVIIKLTGRNIATFSDVGTAKDFLASQTD